MIVYSTAFWGLPLLLRVYGSAFPRALVWGALSGVATALIHVYGGPALKKGAPSPFM